MKSFSTELRSQTRALLKLVDDVWRAADVWHRACLEPLPYCHGLHCLIMYLIQVLFSLLRCWCMLAQEKLINDNHQVDSYQRYCNRSGQRDLILVMLRPGTQATCPLQNVRTST